MRALGPDDPDTIASAVSLARGYYAVGRITDAVKLLQDSLERAERVLHPGHPIARSARESLTAITG
jgi:hypothetical protein